MLQRSGRRSALQMIINAAGRANSQARIKTQLAQLWTMARRQLRGRDLAPFGCQWQNIAVHLLVRKLAGGRQNNCLRLFDQFPTSAKAGMTKAAVLPVPVLAIPQYRGRLRPAGITLS